MFFEPTGVENVQAGSAILREEIFGPVLVIAPFDHEVGVVSNAAAPFGGRKLSGVGREGGAIRIHEYR